jgi:hypothetical protein
MELRWLLLVPCFMGPINSDVVVLLMIMGNILTSFHSYCVSPEECYRILLHAMAGDQLIFQYISDGGMG